MRPVPDGIMLFAAGLGTRMGELTASRPKPLIEVGGRALLGHALVQVENAGGGQVVVNVHYKADQIRAYLADRPDIAISDEAGRLLETGGGLKKALSLLKSEKAFTLNTDAVWTGGNALRQLREGWRDDEMGALLLLVRVENALGHHGKGDFSLAEDGRLSRGGTYVYTGAQLIRTEGLACIPDTVFSLNRLWDRMLTEGRLYGVVHDGGWCDVGQPSSIALAEALLAGQRHV